MLRCIAFALLAVTALPATTIAQTAPVAQLSAQDRELIEYRRADLKEVSVRFIGGK